MPHCPNAALVVYGCSIGPPLPFYPSTPTDMCRINCEVQPGCLLMYGHAAMPGASPNQTATDHALGFRTATYHALARRPGAGMSRSVAEPYLSKLPLIPRMTALRRPSLGRPTLQASKAWTWTCSTLRALCRACWCWVSRAGGGWCRAC
eukprot:100246-Chlamydomonas_euryale.AAC.1